MATYEKIKLSADSTGDGIWLDYTASPVSVHTTGTSSTVLDEIWLYVHNFSFSTTSRVSINIGTTASITQNIGPSSGLILVVPGLIVSGNGTSGTAITATDNSSVGEVVVNGYVNRITP